MSRGRQGPGIRRIRGQAVPAEADDGGHHRPQQEEDEQEAGEQAQGPGEPPGCRGQVRRSLEQADRIDARRLHEEDLTSSKEGPEERPRIRSPRYVDCQRARAVPPASIAGDGGGLHGDFPRSSCRFPWKLGLIPYGEGGATNGECGIPHPSPGIPQRRCGDSNHAHRAKDRKRHIPPGECLAKGPSRQAINGE
jgi:hypothetical protein